MKRALVTVLGLLLGSQLAVAQEQQSSEQTQDKIREVLAGEHREEDSARDDNRQPLEVLRFFRLEDDMRVIELLPFGGWYTRILGPVLRDEGKLYVTQPELGRYTEAMNSMLESPELAEVEVLDWNGPEAKGRNPFVGSGEWDVEPVDMVVTFRNYHNFGYEDRMATNQSAFDALKPGGYYGIVDHTRRHMQPDNQNNGRRADPVQVIKEVQDSGFVLEDYSPVLYRSEDTLELEVGHESISDNTDRFTLLFRKPEQEILRQD